MRNQTVLSIIIMAAAGCGSAQLPDDHLAVTSDELQVINCGGVDNTYDPGECATRTQLIDLARLDCKNAGDVVRNVTYDSCDPSGASAIHYTCCPPPVCTTESVTTTMQCAIESDLTLLAHQKCGLKGSISNKQFSGSCNLQVGNEIGAAGYQTVTFTCCN